MGLGYINLHNAKSPHSITDVHTLTPWITGRSQEFDVITMFRLPEPQSRKISNIHKLSMIFDQQEYFTSKLFDEFLFMKYEEFYQDIDNNKTSVEFLSKRQKLSDG